MSDRRIVTYMSSNPTPKFRKLASDAGTTFYEVSLNGTVVGTIEKCTSTYRGETCSYWFGLHKGETQGLTGSSRIDVAWALINS